jgi:putative transposase
VAPIPKAGHTPTDSTYRAPQGGSCTICSRSGIGLHTPADVHFWLATDKAVNRRTVPTQARARYRHRFGVTRAPKILDLSDSAWINPPAQNTTEETATTAA